MGRWLIPGVVLAALVALFGPALAHGTLLAPTDGLALNYPLRLVVAASLRAGELPFWNPYLFGGMPLLGAIHEGVFFPGNWLFLVLPGAWAWNANVVGAYAIAGLATAALARATGVSRAGAAVSALAYMLGGFMVGHLEHVQILQVAALTPALLWAAERFARTGRRRYPAIGALVVTAMVAAGHPQMTIFALGLAAAYALWRATTLGRSGARYALTLGAAAAVGLALGAPQLLPAIDFVALSPRRTLTFDTLTLGAFDPRQLITLWAPYAFGAAPGPLFKTPYWGSSATPSEVMGGLGMGVAVLALGAIAAWRRLPMARFWAAAGAVALLLAMGGATPLYRLWAMVPVLASIGIPSRHLMTVSLAGAMLAGIGLDALASSPRARRLWVWGAAGAPVALGAGGLLVFGGAIAHKLQPYMPPGLSMRAALDPLQPAWLVPLAVWGLWLALVWRKPVGRFARGAAVALVAAELGLVASQAPWRQASPTPAAPIALSRPLDRADAFRSLAINEGEFPFYDLDQARALGFPSLSALDGVRSPNGYHPLAYARTTEALGVTMTGLHPAIGELLHPRHRLLDVMGVSLLRLTPAAEARWRPALALGGWRRQPGPSGVATYTRAARPSAWRVRRATVAAWPAIQAALSGSGPWRPADEALLEAAPPRAAFAPGPATLTAPSLNRREIVTDGDGPGLVVVGESFDAGWHAEAEGRDLSVMRADGLGMAIAVPAGAHRIHLRYEPRTWRASLLVAALAALLLAIYLLGWPRGRRTKLR